MTILAWLVALSVSVAIAPVRGAEIVAVQAEDGRVAAVEVRLLDRAAVDAMRDATAHDWQLVFAIYVGEPDPSRPPPPPVLGDYIVAATSVRFEPRFPFSSGLSYHARFDLSRFDGAGSTPSGWLDHTFTMPTARVGGMTSVAEIFPSADVWPANALKFYVHFTQTMKAGGVYENVKLVDDSTGEVVDQAFVETRPELWDPDGKRLTVFFHPGRLKRGLEMNERDGPPLQAGRSYTIIVDDAMEDARRQPLVETYRRAITVGTADRTGPDPARWRIEPPPPHTHEPLRLTFDEEIDRALLDRFVMVVDSKEGEVPGTAVVSGGETRWEFTPETPWQRGEYQLLVSRRLEDLAGNTPAGAFEVPGEEAGGKREGDAFIRLRLEID